MPAFIPVSLIKLLAKQFAFYLLIPVASVMLLLKFYPKLSLLYSGIGFGENLDDLTNLKLELGLSIACYYAVFVILKPNLHRYWISLLLPVSFYLFYDYYFISFGKVFKICDMSELPELLEVLPFLQIAGYLTPFAVIAFIFAINLSKIKLAYLYPLSLLFATFFSITIKPTLYLNLFDKSATFGTTQWSDARTAQNGYLTTLLYFEAMMNNAHQLASELYGDGVKYEKSQAELISYLKTQLNPHNIHIIMLESFFNPKLFEHIKYNHPVYHADFSALIKNQESRVISPVFGGFTAEAEFEVLCGAPALHKYSSIEFNSFTGAEVFCLPTLLKNIGYRVVATNSFKPNFFNELNAYRGLGFNEIYFPKQYSPKMDSYLSLVDNTDYMFDGDLFAQNLEFVKKHLQSNPQKPLFNYVLGIYGHLPFKLDETRHPVRLKAQSHNQTLNDEFQHASNQIYYRTEALAHYLKQLTTLDPDSIIIVMGDHLPRLGGQPFYQKMAYLHNSEDNIHKPPVFYMINGKVLKKPELHQYEIINVVFDNMTQQQYCQDHLCNRSNQVLNYEYDMTMARALR